NTRAETLAQHAARMRTLTTITDWVAFCLTSLITIISAVFSRNASDATTPAAQRSSEYKSQIDPSKRRDYIIGIVPATATVVTAMNSRFSQANQSAVQQMQNVESIGKTLERIGQGDLDPVDALNEFQKARNDLVSLQ